MRPFYVYLLRCGDGSYYAGHTDDIDARMRQHVDGDVGYTSMRKPVELVWQGEFESREGALAFEQQIKGWSRAKKEALIAGDWGRIQELARSRPSTSSGRTDGSPNSVRTEPTSSVQAEPVEAHTTESPSTSSGRTGRGAELSSAILAATGPQQRRAMAKAITLLESTRADHRAQADELLTGLLPHTGKSFRLGISGVPGVGKSTFIEALGLYLIAQGHRVAVLAVDPSSSVSGGSILGDKTRMEHLSVHERAYIRPSPSSGTLGGVAEKTRESMLVCEAAGYDVVIVETVGVGQSETAVAGMTDMFVLMQLPNAGDDLQAIKKGVMELADLVVINKADIDADAAMRAQAQITSALRLLGLRGHGPHPDPLPHAGEGADSLSPAGGEGRGEGPWRAQVLQLSALKGTGVAQFWNTVTDFRQLQDRNGQLAARRRHQARAWMWERIEHGLKQAFRQHPAVKDLLPRLAHEVEHGQLPASAAARQLLNAMNPGT